MFTVNELKEVLAVCDDAKCAHDAWKAVEGQGIAESRRLAAESLRLDGMIEELSIRYLGPVIRELLATREGVKCVRCGTALLPDDHDKVRAVHSSLDELEHFLEGMEVWVGVDVVQGERIAIWAANLREIIDHNKEAWGL